MTVTHYMGLGSIERAECLAMLTNEQLMEFGRKFYGDVPYHQEHRAAMHMACIIEALCDELEASLKKIERLEECPDRFNADCECPTCEMAVDAICELEKVVTS